MWISLVSKYGEGNRELSPHHLITRKKYEGNLN